MMRKKREQTSPLDEMDHLINRSGAYLVRYFHYLGLFAIGAVTVWASFIHFISMFDKNAASIEDILTLFIYLEIGAMVAIYFKTTHLPVRYLIYIAITALTKLIIHYTSIKHKLSMDYLFLGGAIVLLALSVLILRYGSRKFPSVKSQMLKSPKKNKS